MNASEHYLRAVASLGSAHAQFLVEHGRAFEPDLLTFRGWQGAPQNCFGNCAMMVLTKDPTLTYVEGYVDAIIPIHHAWVTRDDGTILDPTVRLEYRLGPAPSAYFGVPFDSDFLRQFLLKTKTFGLLDGMSKQSIKLMTGKIKPKKFLAKTLMEEAA